MLSYREESEIIERAYIPEHIVSLMTTISRGEPFLEEDMLYFKGDGWIILVGYPLCGEFTANKLLEVYFRISKNYPFEYFWLIAPQIPEDLKKEASIFKEDYYYTLEISSFRPKEKLLRHVKEASQKLQVSVSKSYSSEHQNICVTFLKYKKPDPFSEGLFSSMANYISNSISASILEARDSSNNLVAFYVVDSSAKDFLTYVVGIRNLDKEISHASDLLFFEMVEFAKKLEKKYIHLGLGVDEGIRRFKKKWGGQPTIPYEFVEIRGKKDFLKKLERILDIL